jgi:hypothetical protein
MIHKNTLNAVRQNDPTASWTYLVKYCIFVVNVGDVLQKCYLSSGLKALAHVSLIVISQFNMLSSS